MMRLRLKKLGVGRQVVQWASYDSITIGVHWIEGQAVICGKMQHRAGETWEGRGDCPECMATAPRIRCYRAAFVGEAKYPSMVELSGELVRSCVDRRSWTYGTIVEIDRRTKRSQWTVIRCGASPSLTLEHHVGWVDLSECFRALWSLPRPVNVNHPWTEWQQAIRLRMDRAFSSSPPLPFGASSSTPL